MTKKHSKKSRETNREQDQTASMCATVHNGAPIIASTKKKKKSRDYFVEMRYPPDLI